MLARKWRTQNSAWTLKKKNTNNNVNAYKEPLTVKTEYVHFVCNVSRTPLRKSNILGTKHARITNPPVTENETCWQRPADAVIMLQLSELALVIHCHLLTPNYSPDCRNELQQAKIEAGTLSRRSCHAKKKMVQKENPSALQLYKYNTKTEAGFLRMDSFT